MKFQLCRFKRTKDSLWEPGVAVLKIFDLSDVEFILDQSGSRLKKEPWSYDLQGTADRAFHAIDLSLALLPNKSANLAGE